MNNHGNYTLGGPLELSKLPDLQRERKYDPMGLVTHSRKAIKDLKHPQESALNVHSVNGKLDSITKNSTMKLDNLSIIATHASLLSSKNLPIHS